MDIRADVLPASLSARPVLPQGAAPPGHGWDPPPRWDGTWFSHSLPKPEILLVSSGMHHGELMTQCQLVPTTATQGSAPAPAHPPWAGTRGLWKASHGAGAHAVPVLCQSYRAVLAPQGLVLPPHSIGGVTAIAAHHRAGELGTYAAFSRHRNNTCSAPCSAPGRQKGSLSSWWPSGHPHQQPPSGHEHQWVA